MIEYRRKSAMHKFEDTSAEDQVYVGLDVHKNSIHAAVRINGKLGKTCVMPTDNAAVIKALRPLTSGLKSIVYEAGPTGYRLARALKKIKWPISVVAPGKTPRESNSGSKSDRLDCRKLAEYSEKNLLRTLAIPTEQEEADRQLTRLRDHLKKKEKRIKQQIKSFLLQYGHKEPTGLTHWSHYAVAKLAELELLPELRFVLDIFLEELHTLQDQLERTERRIKELAAVVRFAEKEARLETHPGVGWRTAMKYLTEVYQPERFNETTEVASYVGLAPLVRQSGETRKEGPLIKAGQGPLRCILVQASWKWVRQDPHAAQVYRRLLSNTGCPQKAIIGMARRMASNLWCMLTRGEDYRYAE